MTRQRQWGLAAAGLAVLGAAGFTWAGAAARPAAEPTDLPHLWQWDLNPPPPPGRRPAELAVVVRSRMLPADAPLAASRRAPLRPGEGTDHLLGADTLADDDPNPDGRLTLQVLDLRQLGVPSGPAVGPLRVNGVLRLYGSGQRLAGRLAGHSIRGGATLHPPAWQRSEMPLVTLTTVGDGGVHEYTVLVAVRRRG